MSSYLPRLAEGLLRETLEDTPVALIHGPRQCGKTTLAREVGEPLGYRYLTFDDAATLEAATQDPVGFIESLPEQTILDEVQRVPELFRAIKASVDENRKPGRFILTGSANILFLPRLADSLAGRMAMIRLRPLAQCELNQEHDLLLDRAFSGDMTLPRRDRSRADLIRRVIDGGYPEALSRKAPHRRRAWYEDYIETVVQRDAREISRIRSIDALPRLLELSAGQTARMIDISSLAAPLQMSRPTVGQYVSLLEILFLIERLPAWFGNRLKRLVKTPKLHVCDTGLACALLGLDADALHADRTLFGQLLETFVVQELRRQESNSPGLGRFYYYRDKDQFEVDLVVDRGGAGLVGVEIKASASVEKADFRGLRKLQRAAGSQFVRGLLLHDGEHAYQFDENLFVVPFQALWPEASSPAPATT